MPTPTFAPARGYSWAPFAPGNQDGLRHGATKPDTVGPLAEEMAVAIRQAAPWTASPAFAAEVDALAWTEAQLRLVRHYLDGKGLVTDDGTPRSTTGYLDRLEGRASRLRANLGMNPMAWAKLLAEMSEAGDDAADVLTQLKAEGRAIVAARAALASGDADGEGGDPETGELGIAPSNGASA